MTGSILSLRQSADTIVRQRAAILSEAQLYDWLVSISTKHEPIAAHLMTKSGITTTLHVSKLLEGTYEKSAPLTVGVRSGLDMDWPQFYAMCSDIRDVANADTADYYDVFLSIDDWPFLVVECIGLAMSGKKLYGENIPEPVRKRFSELFPQTSLEQLALWFDNDLVTMDPTRTDIAQLPDVLINQEMFKPASVALPDFSMD